METAAASSGSQDSTEDVTVSVLSIAGEQVCCVLLPRDTTLADMKEHLTATLGCSVTSADALCHGAESWQEPQSRPLAGVVGSSVVSRLPDAFTEGAFRSYGWYWHK
ncbi:unnamed protein product [Symbiodinium sp. CCMP2456]|nr:unnamed protein product [Symbiodinium sp. CCMP2456]